MREILFRGKRADNGEWEYGDLWCNPYGKRVVCIVSPINDQGTTGGNEVIPETVGQYTGLTDKNGRRILEGDILQGEQYPFNSDGEYNYFAEVCYWDNAPEFGIYIFKNPKANIRGISEGNTCDMQDWESIDWEIIGNIYDNPELMKGGVENG